MKPDTKTYLNNLVDDLYELEEQLLEKEMDEELIHIALQDFFNYKVKQYFKTLEIYNDIKNCQDVLGSKDKVLLLSFLPKKDLDKQENIVMKKTKITPVITKEKKKRTTRKLAPHVILTHNIKSHTMK